METRNSSKLSQSSELESADVSHFGLRSSDFAFRISLFAFLLVVGCGAPGDPLPPTPPVPTAVTDLTAHQLGDGVQLAFTMPSKSVTGDRLAQLPAVEILRGAPKPDGSADARSFRIVYTIPASLVENYLTQDHLQFTDPIAPEDTRAHPGAAFGYLVRTRASKRRSSVDSNFVFVHVYPVPERIPVVEARVTEAAIELSWPAAARTSAGEPLLSVFGYRIYRGELDPASADAASKDLSQAKWRSAFGLLAPSESNSYRDTLFDFGKTYGYVVRSVVLVEGNPLESGDSAPVIVAPRDIFPPAAPQDVVAAILPGPAPGSFDVDLSWSLNVETDLAGYRVYRSEQQGNRGQLLTLELLPTPAYRDTSVEPGHGYWYTVTAVDRTGNESSPSAPVAADLPKPPS